MSIEYSLNTKLLKVTRGKNHRKNLLDTLADIGDLDFDFSGENGLDYLWEDVWNDNGFENQEDYETQQEESEKIIELKYESNLEWLLDRVKDIEDDRDCVEEFISTWMDNDSNYYHKYEVNYLTDKNNHIYAISFSTMCGY